MGKYWHKQHKARKKESEIDIIAAIATIIPWQIKMAATIATVIAAAIALIMFFENPTAVREFIFENTIAKTSIYSKYKK